MKKLFREMWDEARNNKFATACFLISGLLFGKKHIFAASVWFICGLGVRMSDYAVDKAIEDATLRSFNLIRQQRR